MNSQEQSHSQVEELRSAPPAQQPYRRGVAYTDARTKSPVLASLMSLMPGLGQCYVGYYQQGFIHILVVASLITVLTQNVEPFQPLLALFLAFFWLYNIVDAARRAIFYNEALAGLRPMELPDALPRAGFRGSLIGGVALIVLGGLLFAHTRFGFSLHWLERWWPVAFVLAGAYLIFRAFLERKQAEKA